MSVLFYTSGHGFGHATRTTAVAQELLRLAPSQRLFVRTGAPEWIFRSNISHSMHFAGVHLDAGVIEKDLFHQDLAGTLEACRQLQADRVKLLEREVQFVRTNGVDVVVFDIPPLAPAIAFAAGVPAVGISNFSWDFIYDPWADVKPAFAQVSQSARRDYKETTVLLRPPFHHEMDAFPVVEDIPLIARQSEADRESVRTELGLARETRPVALLALRWDALGPHALAALGSMSNTLLLGPEAMPITGPGILRLDDRWQARFLDLIQAADVVISKLGYGIVSECIANHAPLLYVPRYGFAETALIERDIPNWLPSAELPADDFFAGRLDEPIARLLSQPHPFPECRKDGATVAAQRILDTAGMRDT